MIQFSNIHATAKRKSRIAGILAGADGGALARAGFLSQSGAMAERVEAGREGEWDLASVKSLVFNDLRIAVFHAEGRWFALEDRCSHAQVRLSDGWVEGHCVACPWHGAQFDLATGEALSGPAVRPVRTFPVTVEEGRVWVDV